MKKKQFIGTFRANRRGFGFVELKNKEMADLFIAPSDTLNAIDEDIVEVELKSISPKGPEGKILKILERTKTHLALIILQSIEKKYLAYSPILGVDWSIEVTSKQQLKKGDRIIGDIKNINKTKLEVSCELIKFISNISDASKDIDVAVEEFSLEHKFSKEVLKEAQNLKITQKDLDKRKDLTNELCVTIDPDTAKDFDDAISLEIKNNEYHLGVHIADVAHYIQPGTSLDESAIKRANSTYFPGKSIPMLPKKLSSDLCSLKPNEIRLTVSVFMVFDKNGDIKSHQIVRSFIKSKKRFTYKQAYNLMKSEKQSNYKNLLKHMEDLCYKLKQKRFDRGSIDFALDDTVIILDKDQNPIDIQVIEYDISHQMIEEFMLKANEIVAKHLNDKDKTLIYRIHEEPDMDNFKDFFTLATSLGFKLPKQPKHKDIQQVFVDAKETPYIKRLSINFIKAMKLACYSPENIGHYGLALEHYCHFTSPIRRYTDLVIQRLLFDEESKERDLNQIAEICSNKERVSYKAEMSVIILKKLRLLNNFYKKEPKKKYNATITRIKPFGFHFELDKYHIDGFIHVSELKDYFIYDPTRGLVGTHTRKCFSFAGNIKVRIKNIDLIHLESQFELVWKR